MHTAPAATFKTLRPLTDPASHQPAVVALLTFSCPPYIPFLLSACLPAYLPGCLAAYLPGCRLAGEAVMMGWEAPLMEQHARVICGNGGGHYLNVGFGLGIIDTYIQVRASVAVPAAGWLQQYCWQMRQGSSGLALSTMS